MLERHLVLSGDHNCAVPEYDKFRSFEQEREAGDHAEGPIGELGSGNMAPRSTKSADVINNGKPHSREYRLKHGRNQRKLLSRSKLGSVRANERKFDPVELVLSIAE